MPAQAPNTSRSSRLELTRMRGVPPSSCNHNAVRNDPAVTRELLADHVEIVEASVLDRQNRCVSNAAGPQAAELGAPQCECGIDGRGGNHVGERHATA